MTTTHELKTWPEFFEAVRDGRKTFEVRRTDDRAFAAGDVLRLREYDPATKAYTGREVACEVTYVLAGPPWLPEGLAVMGLREPVTPHWRTRWKRPADALLSVFADGRERTLGEVAEALGAHGAEANRILHRSRVVEQVGWGAWRLRAPEVPT